MEVRYTTTIEDYVALCRFLQKRSTIVRAKEMIGWLLVPTLIAIGAIVILSADGFTADGTIYVGVLAATLVAISLVLFPFVFGWVNFVWISRYVKELGMRGDIGPITLILTDAPLVEITETTRSEVKWKDIHSIHESGDYTFIMVTGMSAAILPRHGFALDGDYFMVRDFAKARIG